MNELIYLVIAADELRMNNEAEHNYNQTEIFFLKLTEVVVKLKSECPSVPRKMTKRPSVASKINPTGSEKMSLSASQFKRRKERKTVQALKAIHCDSHVYTPEKEQIKAVKDGLWTTLIGSAGTCELKEYVSNSKTWMNSVIPSITTTSHAHLLEMWMISANGRYHS